MSISVLPRAEEVPALVPQPGSIVWNYAGDARLLATAGYALLLQVAHPTVGAGVSEHSNFKADPWGRLFRTLDYTYAMVYGGPELAAEIGRRVHELHRQIRGIKPNGERYYALEPEAYAWVHGTLVEAIIAGHRLFAERLSGDQIERFYAGWRANGRLVGVGESGLPDSWAGFRAYFQRMVQVRLENTEAVQEVLATLARPPAPPVSGPAEHFWRLVRAPAASTLLLATVGLLPPVLRERFGVRWTPARQLSLRGLSMASRSLSPVMPSALRTVGPHYLRSRREALRRGDVASGAPL